MKYSEQDTLQGQIEYLGMEMQKLDEKTLSSEQISKAVASGMQRAVSSPDFWDAAFQAMGARTKSAAGSLLVTGVGTTLKRAAWFVMAGFAVYIAGGWSALVAMFKIVFGIDPRG